MTLAHHLRTLRERAQIGQAEVAAFVDVSIPTVSEWESGKKKPGRERLHKLAKFYRVSVDDLLAGGEITSAGRATTQEEVELLDLFRRSAPDSRHAVVTLLRTAAHAETN